MLRLAGLSLLLGFTALLVILTQFFAPPAGSGSGVEPIAWNKTNLSFPYTEAEISGDELRIHLSESGNGGIVLATGGIDPGDYAFLHLAVEDPPQDLETQVYLNYEGQWAGANHYTLQNRSPTAVWLATHELEAWNGQINSVALLFKGPGNTTLRIKGFGLYPATPTRQLRSIFSDLTSNTPWRRADMNTHTGVTKVSSFYPIPLAVSLLILSTLAYCLLVLLQRKRITFTWTTVGLIFLACWIALDLVWQNRLLYQVGHSYRLFAGKDTPEKISVGPDAKLFNLVSGAKEKIESQDARVFVASHDDYTGMRGAYYLYPFNAFWTLEPPEIPHDEYLRSGDYILVVQPAKTAFYKRKMKLTSPQNTGKIVELIYEGKAGNLVRLK